MKSRESIIDISDCPATIQFIYRPEQSIYNFKLYINMYDDVWQYLKCSIKWYDGVNMSFPIRVAGSKIKMVTEAEGDNYWGKVFVSHFNREQVLWI